MLRGKGLLTPIQRTFLAAFTRLPDHVYFYLAGGTALAEYYLGHRLSFDLDLFSAESSLILPFSYQVEALSQQSGLTISVTRRFASYAEFLVVQDDERLKIDLAQDSPFRLGPLVETVDGILVSGLPDVYVDKLLAYYGRAEPRDAVDLYFILQQAELQQLMAQAAQKDPGFDPYWFAVALGRAANLPDELDRWPVRMLQAFDPPALKAQFQELALRLMGEITSGK